MKEREEEPKMYPATMDDSGAKTSVPPFIPRQPKFHGPSPLGLSPLDTNLEEPEELTCAGELEEKTSEDEYSKVHSTSSAGSKAHIYTSKVSLSGTDLKLKNLNNVAILVWRDLTVTIKNKRIYSQKVVNTSTGYALPYTLTGIIGPSKCGKSTLLRALAEDMLPRNAKVYGEILINGHTRQLKYGCYAYIKKDHELIETLTVREALHYSALLQLPNSIPLSEKSIAVDEIMKIMELEDLADLYIVGGFHRKGLRWGERKRLTVAMELLLRPQLIFVDEPILNLDSISAVLMMVTLKRLANTGCTVITTVQHTTAEVFGLFDKICVVAKGKTIFFGETFGCLEHFATSGFPCPMLKNPSDHFLRTLNSDFDRIPEIAALMTPGQDQEQGIKTASSMGTDIIIRTLEIAYKASNDAAAVETMVIQLSKKNGTTLHKKSHAGPLAQITVLGWRSFLNMSRDWGYYWLRMALSIFLMVCMGTMFHGLENSPSSFQERKSAVFYMISFVCVMAIGGFPALVKELKIFSREICSQQTHTAVFVLANFISSIPYLFLISTSCSLIGYFSVTLDLPLSSLIYFMAVFFLCLLISEGMMMLIASILLREFEGILTVVVFQGIMMLVAGYFRPLDELPRPVWKYPMSYVSFYTYALEGLLHNEYHDKSCKLHASLTATTGTKASRQTLAESTLFHGKWFNLLILVLMVIVQRIFLVFMINLGEKVRTHLLRYKYLEIRRENQL